MLEQMSAFESEVFQVSEILRGATKKSFVVLDEFGRGTSAREASCLAASVIEHLEGSLGIFATHLHEMYDLPIQHDSLRYWRMEEYRVSEGKCRNSEALRCGRKAGFPEDILNRAEELLAIADGATDAGTVNKGGSRGSLRTPKKAKAALSDVDDSAVVVPSVSLEEELSPPTAPAKTAEELPAISEVKSADINVPHTLETVKARITDILGFDAQIDEFSEADRPPPSLMAQTVVYVLHLKNGQFYVGETAALGTRLATHRRQKPHNTVLVTPVADKSAAQRVETTLIRELQRRGFDLISAHDGGRHVAVAGI